MRYAGKLGEFSFLRSQNNHLDVCHKTLCSWPLRDHSEKKRAELFPEASDIQLAVGISSSELGRLRHGFLKGRYDGRFWGVRWPLTWKISVAFLEFFGDRDLLVASIICSEWLFLEHDHLKTWGSRYWRIDRVDTMRQRWPVVVVSNMFGFSPRSLGKWFPNWGLHIFRPGWKPTTR